jgi:2-amino-4-hydroxy-6-hydroxymethyldihydropteridine diphosphokinase
MSTCLIALGSNLGDREASLNAALADFGALPGVRLQSQSRWHATQPVGCVENQPEFLNGAALCETAIPPQALLKNLRAIETRHGRQRSQRWADRTLDLDLLLYDDQVIETPSLTLPHPRMSFRRFVLAPSVEIAGQLIHPTIGWTLRDLLRHLDDGADCVAIVSPDERLRRELAELLVNEFPAAISEPPRFADFARLWPIEVTTLVAISCNDPESVVHAASKHPKLTILLGPATSGDTADKSANWPALCRQRGRGPTLRIPDKDAKNTSIEAFAAAQAVWPGLCPRTGKRLE